MSRITDTWRAAIDGARIWGREVAADWRHTVREITGQVDADRWHAERLARQDAGRDTDPGWLAQDADGRTVEVDADGYPGREADPDDGRPVVDAEEDAKDAAYQRWAQEREAGQATGNPPASRALDREVERTAKEWPEITGPEREQAEIDADARENYNAAVYPPYEGPGYTEPLVDWPGWHEDHTEYEKDRYWDGHYGEPLPEDPDPWPDPLPGPDVRQDRQMQAEAGQ